MGYPLKAVPEAQAILRAWTPFKQLIGVTAVRTDGDHAQARATSDALLDEVGDDESHPLAEVLDYLADQVKAYEDENVKIPEAAPNEVLRFLMEQHGHKQEDLTDCAPQSRISDILSGKRSISKEIAKRLAHRFHVRADLFLQAAFTDGVSAAMPTFLHEQDQEDPLDPSRRADGDVTFMMEKRWQTTRRARVKT